MSKQYCFKIINPSKVKYDVEELQLFVKNLYIKKNKGKITEENIPFVTIYVEKENDVCITMITAKKSSKQFIEDTNKLFTKRDLKWKNGISLSEPFEFTSQTEAWWAGFNAGNKTNFEQEKLSRKWNTLSHNGPYFIDMQKYNFLGSSLIYEGKKYKLTPEEEKVARLYANRIIAEEGDKKISIRWLKDPVFNKNFWNDFQKYLSPKLKKVFKNFSKIGWDNIVSDIKASKDIDVNKEEKIQKKVILEQKKRGYGYAFINGNREKIGNFNVEPMAILYGRGDNPKRGRIKKEIMPEDVIINVGKNDPVPKPPNGHQWKEVVHNPEVSWLARWRDPISGEPKYVKFSPEGRLKGESDLIKYEKARKLEKYIEIVREKYMSDAFSDNLTLKQLGTVLYLIDHFGVRVGGDKDDDTADTVGASTLRTAHIKLVGSNTVKFDFLGKDSIRYDKELKVPNIIYDNFLRLVSGKQKSDEVFDLIKSKNINDYLKTFDKDFSAKVFRTRLASSIMYRALKDIKVPDGAKKKEITTLFNRANSEVAKVLNHVRNIPKKEQEAVDKLQSDLKKLESENGKNKKIIEDIQKLKEKIANKSDVLAVAMKTSLDNYIDPRIVVAWSEQNEADISAIYSPTLIKKFKWAIDITDAYWDWKTTPLIISEKLDSTENYVKKSVKIPAKIKTPRRVISNSSHSMEEDNKPITSLQKKKSISSITPTTSSYSIKHKLPGFIGPGNVNNYKLLLLFCQDPEENKYNLLRTPRDVLEWIVPFAKYAIKKGSTIRANYLIVRFYEEIQKHNLI